MKPEEVKEKYSYDQFKLYKLIYDKFLASQAADAVFDSVNVTINSGNFAFKCSGKTTVFDGFLAIYNIADKTSKDEKEEKDENQKLPNLEEGEVLDLKDIKGEQKFMIRKKQSIHKFSAISIKL